MNVKPMAIQKFNNIDANAFSALIRHNYQIGLCYDTKMIDLGRRALITKGIWSYLKNMDQQKMRSRIMFGFLRKRSAGKVQVFVSRWWFLISARPLNIDDFLNDDQVLQEGDLPPLLEFDTMYYYYMDSTKDESSCQGMVRT
jgi:hypothetical protein